MLEDRFVITDRQWLLMEPHCLGKKSGNVPVCVETRLSGAA